MNRRTIRQLIRDTITLVLVMRPAPTDPPYLEVGVWRAGNRGYPDHTYLISLN